MALTSLDHEVPQFSARISLQNWVFRVQFEQKVLVKELISRLANWSFSLIAYSRL